MDQLTSDLSRATLGTSATTAYEQAFNRIVAFVGKIRNLSPVDDADEISVTRALASPFTPSGTLVLLTEPREYHPWDQGTDQVISTCNSLEVLDEGFRIATQGQYNLATHVSVLDVRPFLPKSRLPSDEEVLTELYDLVFSAIKAKNPTALLCVGNEARHFFEAREFRQPIGCSYETKVVYAKHPSCSVNYNETDGRLRLDLWDSIDEAVQAERIVGRIESYSKNRLEAFLKVIMRCCLDPCLPDPNITKRAHGRYTLGSQHNKRLNHIQSRPSDVLNPTWQAQALLAPIVRELNSSFIRTSWFNLDYEVVDWPRILRMLKDALPAIEDAIYCLAGDEEAALNMAGGRNNDGSQAPDGITNSEFCLILPKIEEITKHANELWE